jgi:uncharacterized protein YacL
LVTPVLIPNTEVKHSMFLVSVSEQRLSQEVVSLLKKMENKTKALLFQLPAIILLIVATIGSWVVKIGGFYDLTWGTPIILTVILVLYFYGRSFSKSKYPY